MTGDAEFIRNAIHALPVNNGAGRRAVYEQVRESLANELRGLIPPIGSTELAQRHFQLENTIRQIEREER